MQPKKFAFLVHLRSSYRKDLAYFAKPLGLIPDAVYRLLLSGRPMKPFIWSEVTVTPGAQQTEGYIIMLPYSGRQLMEQQKEMLPLVEKAMQIAAEKGAEIFGLGALSSPITLGGKLVANNPHAGVTNGNAYTAVITYQKIAQLISQCKAARPTVALVGASGSVGSLVCKLIAQQKCNAGYLLVARNLRRLNNLALDLKAIHAGGNYMISQNMADVKHADIVVLLTSAADCLLQSKHLKKDAIVLDDTQPRNTHPSLLKERPDVSIIDGGLVAVPHLKFLQRSIALPKGISFACLAETILLARAGHTGNFSIGNPTLQQANHIMHIADSFAELGFGIAPDHCFGKPVKPKTAFSETVAAFEPVLQVA